MLGIWRSEMERIWNRKSTILLYIAFVLIVIANIWSLKITDTMRFRFGEGIVAVNNLNLPWLMMSEVSLFLITAMLPILYVDQLSGDIHSGAYRLYVLRPYRRFQFWLGKLLALSVTTMFFTGTTLLIGVFAGWMLFPNAATFFKYGSTLPSTSTEAVSYTLAFYLLLTLVCLAKLMLSSVVCLFISRPLFAFIAILALSMFLYPIFKPLVVLMDPFQQILLALRVDGSFKFWMCLGMTVLLCSIVSFTRWQKKVI
ncbi:ABC transporter permease [Paenibacillus sp. 28ISP30-2]|uniref:ABC transporter permease n=1 Tax=Paenibacillus terrae TaxID=159743 RepID=UPI0011EB432C|nr:ABC transporter permease [Paenibacillus terrae]MBE0340040.1 ABC transporter permease [Paenibacillus sp. 28ISP30-2]